MERGAYPIHELAPIMSDENILKILHNAKFDHQVLYEFGFEMYPVFDTFIAECMITNGYDNRSLGLGDVAFKYAQVRLDKSVRGKIIFQGLTDEVIKYAADDVTYLHTIYKAQREVLQRLNILGHCFIECQDTAAYAEMEYRGIKFDTEAWNNTYLDNKHKLKLAENKLNDIYATQSGKKKLIQTSLFDVSENVVTGINWNSPKQVIKAFGACGYYIASSKEDVIEKLKNFEIAKQYLLYKDLQTQCSKFGSDYLKFIKNGRLYFDVWQCLDTMRVAIKKPNVSQIPQDNRYRNCFVADEGWVFVDHDYSSQELALIAADSQDPVWLDAINNNYDLHSVAAELVFKDKWKNTAEPDCAYYTMSKQKCECKQHKKMRTNVKTINYGLAYGAGPSKLSDIMNISLSEAKTLHGEYFKAFPALKNYFERIKAYIRANNSIRSMGGYAAIRNFNTPNTESESAAIQREGMNARIQMTGACIMKHAVYLLSRERKKVDYPVKFVMTVHDAIVTTVPIEHAEHWSEIQKHTMIEASKIIVPSVFIGVDTSITPIWKK